MRLNSIDDFMPQARQIVVNRALYYSQQILTPDTLHLSRSMDVVVERMGYHGEMAIRHMFSLVQSQEIRDDSRTIQHPIKLYASWQDHLKHDLQDLWMKKTKWIRWRWFTRVRTDIYLRLIPKYVEQKIAIEVPVKVSRVCPHIDAQWGKDEYIKHFHYIDWKDERT